MSQKQLRRVLQDRFFPDSMKSKLTTSSPQRGEHSTPLVGSSNVTIRSGEYKPLAKNYHSLAPKYDLRPKSSVLRKPPISRQIVKSIIASRSRDVIGTGKVPLQPMPLQEYGSYQNIPQYPKFNKTLLGAYNSQRMVVAEQSLQSVDSKRRKGKQIQITQNNSMVIHSETNTSEDQRMSSTQYASTFYKPKTLDKVKQTPSNRPITAAVNFLARTNSGSRGSRESLRSKITPRRTFNTQANHDTSAGSRADLYINSSFQKLDSEQTIKQQMQQKSTGQLARPRTGLTTTRPIRGHSAVLHRTRRPQLKTEEEPLINIKKEEIGGERNSTARKYKSVKNLITQSTAMLQTDRPKNASISKKQSTYGLEDDDVKKLQRVTESCWRENDQISVKIQQYSEYHRLLVGHHEPQMNRSLKEDIHKLGNLALILQGQLNQTVRAVSKIHFIDPENDARIEVAPMSNYIVKFQVGGHRGPVRLKVRFESVLEQQLVTFVHKSQQKLSETTYLWRFINKTAMIMRPREAYDPEAGKHESQDVWQPDFLYAMFTSKGGCAFNLSLNFVEEDELEMRRQMVNDGQDFGKKIRYKFRKIVDARISALENDPEGLTIISKEIRALKLIKKQREQMEQNSDIDFVLQNIESTNPVNRLQEDLDKPSKEEMIERARINREVMERETRLKNLATLRKWSFIKDQRLQYERHFHDVEQHRLRLLKWTRHARIFLHLAAVSAEFKRQVAAIRLHERKDRVARKFQRQVWSLRNFRYGENPKARFENRTKHAITFSAQAIRSQETRARELASEFMVEAHKRADLYHKIKNLFTVVSKFSKTVKQHMKSRIMKRQFLLFLFNREFSVLEEYYRQKAKKNKKLKPTLKLFSAIDKKLKDTDEADVDNLNIRIEARKRHLLDEYFDNVCYAYFGWQLRLYYIQRAHLTEQQLEDSQDSNEKSHTLTLSQQSSTLLPIKLTDSENFKMHEMTKRVHQGLQNCFEGTKLEPVHIVKEEGSPKKKKQAEKVNHYSKVTLPESTNLTEQIMSNTQFALKSVKTKKSRSSSQKKKKKKIDKKAADETVIPIEIQKLMKKPDFRYVPDRATMQRLVMRFVNFQDDFKGFGRGEENLAVGDLSLNLTKTDEKNQ